MPINYERWDNVLYFELYQVACLWLELEPPTSVASFHLFGSDNQSLATLYQDLVRAIQYSDLSSKPHNTHEAFLEGKYERSVVSRGELLKLAQKQGVRPLFLYPLLRQEHEPVREIAKVEQTPISSSHALPLTKIDVPENLIPDVSFHWAKLDRIPSLNNRGKPGRKRGPYEKFLWNFLWLYFTEDMDNQSETFQHESIAELSRRFRAHCKNVDNSCKVPGRSSLNKAVTELRREVLFYVEEHGNPLTLNTDH